MRYQKIAKNAMSLLVILFFIACSEVGGSSDGDSVMGGGYTEKELSTIRFTNAEFIYNGDDIGDATSDNWVIKLYTDMDIDELGNPIGPGSVMQLLLNVPYEQQQTPNLQTLEGVYTSQSNSGDFSPNTFVYGYMNIIELPNGRVEMPDATFYATIADGSTEMDVDLIDDGRLEIIISADGTLNIEGLLVGKQCRKRKFEWKGVPDIESGAVPQIPNSTLQANITLTSLTKAQVQDKGDSFYLGDESYRNLLIFLADEGISFGEWGELKGSGSVLRLELLVPWTTDVTEGVPAGTYTMLVRNADTSFDRDIIEPFRVVPGLPNRFMVPYWSGAWYVNYIDGIWGDSYACIDKGTVEVERGADGSHRFICNLQDCSSPSFAVVADVTVQNRDLRIL